jgi:hypothetical protein
MQPRSLKCQAPVPLITATELTAAAHWHLRRLLNRCRRLGNALIDSVPSRASTPA